MRQYTVGLQSRINCDNCKCQNMVLMNGNALCEEVTRTFRKSLYVWYKLPGIKGCVRISSISGSLSTAC